MQRLNLIKKELSDIDYNIVTFPDGEVHIKLGDINRKEPIEVHCRVTNAEDLFILAQVGDIINRQGVMWGLHIYYLMSMRMDRVISFNESFSLKVVSDIINGLNPKYIFVSHPHSFNTIELLKNSYVSNSIHPNYSDFEGEIQLCYPDKGAYERYGQIYNEKNKYPILLGKKVRNAETGNIDLIQINNPEDYQKLPVMVVDDLCDGGGTFVGIANCIKQIDKNADISISVIHMVNSKGIVNLSQNYNKVYFTNTYKDWTYLPSNCEMFDVIQK